jgi:tRNA pseudouridine55 synthase
MNTMDTTIKTGFLLINKPAGISSYGCIGRIKYLLRQKAAHSDSLDLNGGPHAKSTRAWGQKVGHAGTLDPFASGLLIVAIGRQATRLLSQCMVMDKVYKATGKCGELTDTLDCTGQIVATADKIPSEQELRNALDSLGSEYEQIPPLYSALKYQGKPMYLLARKKMMDEEQLQEIADTKKRIIKLYDKQFLSYQSPFFIIQVRVSHGTYIRTLINDIAVRAGSCATTYELTRIAIGTFNLDQAIDLSVLTSENINAYIISEDVFFN